MRIPNREINIFNLSMLDIICGALGAFLIVTIILIPSYQNQAEVKVAEVTEKKQQNIRMKEEIAKLKAQAKDDERLEKMRKESEQLAAELAERKQELQRKQQEAGGAGITPPMYFYVYWGWDFRLPGGKEGYPLIDLKVSVTGQSADAEVDTTVVAEGPEYYDRIGRGYDKTSGFGAKFVVINNPTLEAYELHYEVLPLVPPMMYIGGYVQHGERALSLGDVLLEPPGRGVLRNANKGFEWEGFEWKHLYGTAKRVKRDGKKDPVLFFERSEEGKFYNACAARKHQEVRNRLMEPAVQSGPGVRRSSKRCWFEDRGEVRERQLRARKGNR